MSPEETAMVEQLQAQYNQAVTDKNAAEANNSLLMQQIQAMKDQFPQAVASKTADLTQQIQTLRSQLDQANVDKNAALAAAPQDAAMAAQLADKQAQLDAAHARIIELNRNIQNMHNFRH